MNEASDGDIEAMETKIKIKIKFGMQNLEKGINLYKYAES